jgi:membrane fusion protein, multidrug efflux system
VEVTLGKRFDDKLEILSETLKTGDMLVSDGQAKLVQGDKIQTNN